ncbi:MAG: NAD(+)/NADH kinase [Clostridiaceae bacterium]|nr:NAD(+)/NADH kinase [Clostridiaceae bacterium]
MKRIAVIPNTYKDKNLEGTKQAVSIIKSAGIVPMLDEQYKGCGIEAEYVEKTEFSKADMLVVLGGDGTILSTVSEYGIYDIPLLGINHGRLGFLTEIEKADGDSLLNVLKGEYTVQWHMMLDVAVGAERFNALNDAVIHRGNSSKMLQISLYVEDALVSCAKSDGLIIATPTGSTAYSLSAGGPIADPVLDVIIATPICPHNLHSRSIIVPANKKVKVCIEKDKRQQPVLIIDGQKQYPIIDDEEIVITGGSKIGLVRTRGNSFYEKLRRKLYLK